MASFREYAPRRRRVPLNRPQGFRCELASFRKKRRGRFLSASALAASEDGGRVRHRFRR